MGLPAAIIHEFLLDIRHAEGGRRAAGAVLTLSDGQASLTPGNTICGAAGDTARCVAVTVCAAAFALQVLLRPFLITFYF